MGKIIESIEISAKQKNKPKDPKLPILKFSLQFYIFETIFFYIYTLKQDIKETSSPYLYNISYITFKIEMS